MTVKLKITTQSTLERLKLGMVSSFQPHGMCKKSRGLQQKLDTLHVQTGQSLSEYQDFGRQFICYMHGNFILLNLFEIQTFLRSVCTIQSEVIIFQHVLTSFALFHSFTDLFRELNDREIEKH